MVDGGNRGDIALPLPSLLEQHDFEPDATRVLTAAFDQAWAKVIASRSPLAEPGNAEKARIILAKHLIARAQSGQRDVNRLIEDGLAFLAGLRLPLPRF